MLEWLMRLFRRDGPPRTEDRPQRDPSSESRIANVMSALEEAHEKAWWKDRVTLVSETDQQLAVIGPRSDVIAGDLKALGEALERWQTARSDARHIWGLDDLLAGKHPRTPPIYLTVPVPVDRFHEFHEPVALVFVAAGADLPKVAHELQDHLREFHDKLAWFASPEEYSYQQR